MLDPQYPLQKALYKALTETPILYDGQVVPVYQFVPSNPVVPCILLNQPVAIPAGGSISCTTWDCSFLLNVTTRFKVQNEVSAAPAYAISEQILERVLHQRLPLEGGFAMGTIKVSMMEDSQDFKVTVDYLKYIRLRVKVHK